MSDTQITSAWLSGMVKALPIVFGYIPIGFAYGVLAEQAGLSLMNTLLMSVIVYAGSSQLIAVGLFAAAVPGLTIILTTFIVNLRHMLFSAALSPYLKGWSIPELALFSYELTDESFALHSAVFLDSVPPKPEIIAINMTAQASWVLGSVLGASAGQLIGDVKPLALDYTLPAMFIALLVMQVKSKSEIIVALAAGLLAIILRLTGMDQWSVIAATVVGAFIGVGLEEMIKRTKSGDAG
ncbi:MAG: AzlC family ABC transporter permease [Anaerolineae bacterium]|nr:AzlC family ABC transporter permease [Anaerolineae bacterium]